MRRVFFSQKAQKDRERLSHEVDTRVVEKLEYYRHAPDPLAFAKRLHDDPEGTHRFQISDWRAKFVIKNHTIVITRILHRSEAYR